MFVKPLPDGRVAVVVGKFEGFNHWHDEVALGWIVDNPIDGFRVALELQGERPSKGSGSVGVRRPDAG
jgi:hypothetical protein